MVRLVEIYETPKGHILREIYVNPKHIISLREDMRLKTKLSEGFSLEGLDENHCFTKVVLDRGSVGLEIIVVGTPSQVETKLQENIERRLLNG
jgi:hypothetical protein